MRRWVQVLAGSVMTCLLAVFGVDASVWAFDITSHHYDTHRTGWNKSETILTPGLVRSPSFGLIASVMLDEQVDAQPLVMLNQTIKGQGMHTVVYVATENNTIYAIAGGTGRILLSRNLGPPVSYTTTGFCSNNSSSIGIGATPVIDASTGILYVITDTLENGAPTFRLHALKLQDLTDAMPSVVINASHTLSDGSTYNFKPSVSRSRSALLLLHGNVYAGFASYCDFLVDHTRGWILGWNAQTLAPLPNDWLTNSEAMSPDSFFLTSIWMSGSGVAGDSSGIYFITGNSDDSGNYLELARQFDRERGKIIEESRSLAGLLHAIHVSLARRVRHRFRFGRHYAFAGPIGIDSAARHRRRKGWAALSDEPRGARRL
jgi:hypothetical protein